MPTLPVLTDHADRPVVVECYDADTFRLAIILEAEGGLIYAPWLRLAGVDAPELYQSGGGAAREWAVSRLTEARRITVRLHGWSFDRRVADVHVDETCLATDMVAAGHATRYEE